MKRTVGGLPVLDSGAVVAHQREEIILYPFSDDAEYGLRVAILFDDSYRNRIRIINSDENSGKEMILRCERKFVSGDSFANGVPLVFAQSNDETEEYLISASVQYFGTPASYTVIFSYTIVSREVV